MFGHQIQSVFFFVFCSAATGVGRCKVDNAGCWQEKRGDIAFSACQVRFIRVFYTVEEDCTFILLDSLCLPIEQAVLILAVISSLAYEHCLYPNV